MGHHTVSARVNQAPVDLSCRVARTFAARARAWGRSLLLPAVTLSAGCGVDAVVHNLEEREANKVVEVLADADIVAQKVTVDNGRTVSFTINVPNKNRIEAIKTLNRNQMPRRPDSGYQEVFKEGGLIPTAGEERAKQLAAIEGEIEKQLKLVDGILDSQVQLVLPEESALRTAQDVRSPTTASVTIKYAPGPGGAKPLSEPQVQAIVAAGVERLTPDNVVVVMTPATGFGRGSERGGDYGRDTGGLHGLSGKQVNMVFVGMVAIVILLCVFLIGSQVALRTVRSRLTRLQNEIAKARRKPEGAILPPAAG